MGRIPYFTRGGEKFSSYVLGWLWYSPKLFGEKWAKGIGVELGNATQMPMAAMIWQAGGTFLLSWVVGVTAANEALLTLRFSGGARSGPSLHTIVIIGTHCCNWDSLYFTILTTSALGIGLFNGN
jgi:hypothetical protein